MNRRGSALAAALFLIMGITIGTRFMLDMLAASIACERRRTAVDFALLSAARVRAQSMQTIAARWNDFGAPVTIGAGTLEAPADLVGAIAAGADALRRSLSGFQGRVSSALTVAAEANGVSRTEVFQTEPAGLRLSLESQTAMLSAPGMPAVAVPGLWLRRTWTGESAAGTARIETAWDAPAHEIVWPLTAAAVARLEWDVDASDPAAAGGNGGFAPDWASAAQGALFRPNRHPVFRASLGASAS